MKRLLLILLAASVLVTPLTFATSKIPALRITDGWIRLLPGDLPAGGYMTIHNLTDTPAELVSVSSPVFDHIMLHKSMHDHGMSHMKEISKVTIPARGQVQFSPGQLHLMLMQRNQDIQVGQVVVMTLHFADGRTLQFPFQVRPANATGPADKP